MDWWQSLVYLLPFQQCPQCIWIIMVNVWFKLLHLHWVTQITQPRICIIATSNGLTITTATNRVTLSRSKQTLPSMYLVTTTWHSLWQVCQGKREQNENNHFLYFILFTINLFRSWTFVLKFVDWHNCKWVLVVFLNVINMFGISSHH